jgi:ubiquinone/menaquinone biosynthesis C-methylase UbiE
VNFDRVADVYDATRAIPDPSLGRIVDCIVEVTAATPETRFLEIGVGTGRIALPIARRGYDYTGIDISERMMAVLKEKAAGTDLRLQLLTGDVTQLPFADNSFDVVIAVHILHLIPDWMKALEESRRVLKPNGFFVQGGTRIRGWAEDARRQWRVFVEEEGKTVPPRHGDLRRVEEALTDMGCYLAAYRAAEWEYEVIPLELLERVRARTFSQSWDIPEDVLERVHQKLLTWGEKELGDLRKTQTVTEEFGLLVTRFPEG